MADDIIVFAPKCRRFVVDFLRISHLPPIVFHLHMFYIPFSAWRIWPLLIICFSVLFFLHTYIHTPGFLSDTTGNKSIYNRDKDAVLFAINSLL